MYYLAVVDVDFCISRVREKGSLASAVDNFYQNQGGFVRSWVLTRLSRWWLWQGSGKIPPRVNFR